MGGIFFFLILLVLSYSLPSFGNVDSGTAPLPPPPPPPPPPFTIVGGIISETSGSLSAPPSYRPEPSPFRPGIAVTVCVLTTMFSVTFLILLYARHCKRGEASGVYGTNVGDLNARATERKNSGIDRAVIESLPIFRFSSLRGQKDGLDCAVCLTKFEPIDVLRLLPKCKHAFHVECVDTWLDAHSTCPLCRYRVDPEDILLVETNTNGVVDLPGVVETGDDGGNCFDIESGSAGDGGVCAGGSGDTETDEYRRISGRHSSAGERASKLRCGGGAGDSTTSFRRSLDGYYSSIFRKKNNTESLAVRCFDGQRSERKDGLLLLTKDNEQHHQNQSQGARLEHRIVVSAGRKGGFHQRWSDVQPSDLLYLRSEMIISDGRRSSASGSRPSFWRLGRTTDGSGRNVINERSVSEITGLNRFAGREASSSSSNSNNCNKANDIRLNQHLERRAGVVSRWLAWISTLSQSRPAVRSEP